MKRISDLVMIAAKAIVAAFLSLHLLQGCGGGCLKTNDLRTMLNSSLKVGDTQREIETVLGNIGFSWTYTDFLRRYNTTIRDEAHCGAYQAISVYIYLDDARRLAKIEVLDSYTMP